MKTFMANSGNIKREWLIVDASGMPLGRLASQVAFILRGKHKPTFTPHADAGDYVIVINTDKVILTGKKLEQKTYFRHSGYIGVGAKFEDAKDVLNKKSDFAVSKAIKGMLPKNAIGRAMFSKCKVYKDDKHPHEAQMPKPYKIDRKGAK
ncbi:MAG: 50S ribosomal protein L13 [Firmicutes bacterium]|nr:50S ribosomal protein L13 [Bacillota bacterium]